VRIQRIEAHVHKKLYTQPAHHLKRSV